MAFDTPTWLTSRQRPEPNLLGPDYKAILKPKPMAQDREALSNSSPATAISSYSSPGSSVLILPSPHGSDASNRSTQFPSIPEPKPSQAAQGPFVFDTGSTESINSVQAVVGSVNTITTTTTGDEMIMPDEAIETGDFRYPTPETFGSSRPVATSCVPGLTK